MTIRAALIGCGDQGGRHLDAYQHAIAEGEDVQVAAVCDTDAGRAKQLAKRAPGARAYTDYRELIEHEEPDVVSVVTPPVVHREQTLAALAKGAHVLCEKPPAMNLMQAQEMVEEAGRAGRKLGMGVHVRFWPEAPVLKSVLSRGELGPVYHVRGWVNHPWSLPRTTHFLSSALAGGGVIAATAVHLIDLVLWLLGDPDVVSVSASTFAKVPHLDRIPPPYQGTPDEEKIKKADDVEDFGYLLLRLGDGCTFSVESSWLQHPCPRPFGIQFLAARGVAEFAPFAVREDGSGQVVERTPPGIPWPDDPLNFRPVVRDFLHAVRSGGEPVVTPAQILKVQAVLDAAYASAREGKEVRLG